MRLLFQLLKDWLVYGLANQLPKVLGILVLPIITRDLNETDFGIYGIVLAYASALEALTTLGLRVVIQNTFYRFGNRFRPFWNHIYGFLSLWIVPYLLIHFIVVWSALGDDVGNRSLIAMLSAGSSLFFSPVAMIGSTFYQLSERPSVIASIGASAGILGVLLNLLFISHLKLGYLGWFWSSFITSILINAVYFLLVNRDVNVFPKIPFRLKFLSRSLKVALPTLPHFYSMFLLNSSDRVIMNLYKVPTEDIGKYNVAYTVGNVFQSLAMSAGFAITPLMMRCYHDGDERGARRLVFFLQGIFLSTSFAVCLWMKEVFHILIKNDSLSQMYYLGIIIVMSFNYRPIYFGAVNRLIFLERTSVLWQLSFIPGLVNVILNLAFLPYFGYEFAAVSTFVTFTLMGLLGYLRPNLHAIPYYSLAWALLNIALVCIAYLCRDMNPLVKFILSLTLLAIAIFMGIRFLRSRSQIKEAQGTD